MDRNKRHFLLRFFEWDLTATIAGVVALALIVGFGFAAAVPVAKFDFQGAAIDDIVSGSTPVMGSLDLYPEQGLGDIVYGWTNANVQEYSDQDVSNKLERDSNSSTNANTFKIAGLTAQKYTFRFTVGSSDIALATKIIFSPQITTSLISDKDEWVTKDIIYEVSEGEDPMTLDFVSADGSTSWGIAGLAIYDTDEPIVPPSFNLTVSPGSVTMMAGDSVSILVGITPDEDYTYSIDFDVSDLPSGMTAEFNPTSLKEPPGGVSLTISTSKNIAPTNYSITLRAAGGTDDPESVVKTTALNITVNAEKEEEEEEEEEEEDDDDEEEEVIEDDPEITETERVKESTEGFELIGEYIDIVEDNQLIIDEELSEIDRVAREFSGFPVVDLPPFPTSTTDSALQTLTALGIIDSVVSSAPPGQRASKTPPNLWQRFMGAILSPAGG